MVRVKDFNFPIDSLTFIIEENRQVPNVKISSIAKSQAWIDTHLVGEEKMKFDLHQSIPLTDEEMRVCIKIESSFLHIEKHAPMFL